MTGAGTCSIVRPASASPTPKTELCRRGRLEHERHDESWDPGWLIANRLGSPPVTTQIPPFIDCDSMAPERWSTFGVAHVLIMWVLGIS
jgi:hypothetical protein